MATGGLYNSGAETNGLYGNTVSFGGTYFEWFIFKEASSQPATPTGGSWSFSTNTGTPPSGWSLLPPSAPTNQIWVSIALVNSKSTAALVWTAPGLFGTLPQFTFPTPITGAAGTNAAVANLGTATNPSLQFTIPRGDTGATGATGATGTAATVAAGTTTTGAAGTSASVTNSGTSAAAVFNFTIPRGDVGDTGATGATGATGSAATIAAGTTTTTAPGTSATVTNVGTSSAAVFNFGIPSGAGVITGGTTGQFLAKASNTNYDTTWLSITGGLSYQGTWNASTNTPTLTSSSGTAGTYYIVSVAGTTNLNGITDWQIGDWAIYTGSVWQKIDQSNLVTSVNGYTGAVNLTAADVSALSNITSTDGSVTVTTPSTGVRDLSVAVAAATNNVLVQVRNTTGATLTKGTVVYMSGATGQIPTVSKAIATSDATSAQTLGMLTADLANNSNGNVTVIGLITDIDTSAYADGAQLYLSGTTAGAVTATKTYAPTHLVYVGVVEYSHAVHGKIFVKVQNGYELDELHNVSAQTPTTGQTIVYNSATSLWEQNTVSLSAGVNGTLPVANGGTGVTTSTGSGSVVLSTSPTFVTPILGTPTSGTLTNCTGYTYANLSGTVPTWNQNTTGTAAALSATLVAASGGTGLTSVGSSGNVLTSNGTTWVSSALPASVSLSTANTWTATQTFNGSSSTFGSVMLDAAETVNVVGSAPASTTNLYVQSGSVQYYTSNAANNFVVNLAFSSGTSMNTALATGQSATAALVTTQNSTAYYATSIQVDGTTSGVTTKWIGGAPTAGNASGLDVYRFAVIKVSSGTYTVLASLTQYK